MRMMLAPVEESPVVCEKRVHGMVRFDVKGAPVRIGQPVTVGTSLDPTADERFDARAGTVTGLHYDPSCPDQFPADPLIAVAVPGLGEDLFFAEELQLDDWARRVVMALRRQQREHSTRSMTIGQLLIPD